MVQMLFPNNDAIFQDDNSPIHTQLCSVLVSGAWRCTSTSSLARKIAWLKYNRTNVVSFTEYGETQIPSSIISQATRRCYSWRVVQYSNRGYSVLIWVYSKKDTRCITGKYRPNSVLIKKFVSFTSVSNILSIPFILKDYRYSPWPWEEERVLWPKRWLHNLASKMRVREMATDQEKLVQTCYKHEHSEMWMMRAYCLSATHLTLKHSRTKWKLHTQAFDHERHLFIGSNEVFPVSPTFSSAIACSAVKRKQRILFCISFAVHFPFCPINTATT